MLELKRDTVQNYLTHLHGTAVTIVELCPLGKAPEDRSIKEYGYGTPVRVDYVLNQQRHRAVVHTMSSGPFGHEHMADRAQVLLWEHASFNRLPQHVRSLDVGGFTQQGDLITLGDVEEFFHLTGYGEGNGYFQDLARLQSGDDLTELDMARADALCDYLVAIHQAAGS